MSQTLGVQALRDLEFFRGHCSGKIAKLFIHCVTEVSLTTSYSDSYAKASGLQPEVQGRLLGKQQQIRRLILSLVKVIFIRPF